MQYDLRWAILLAAASEFFSMSRSASVLRKPGGPIVPGGPSMPYEQNDTQIK